jgi:hypothetical protein
MDYGIFPEKVLVLICVVRKTPLTYTEEQIKWNVFSEVDRVLPLGCSWWPFRPTLA